MNPMTAARRALGPARERPRRCAGNAQEPRRSWSELRQVRGTCADPRHARLRYCRVIIIHHAVVNGSASR